MAAVALTYNGCLKPRVDDQPRTSAGVSTVLSSSYLGRLCKVTSFKMRLTRTPNDRYVMPDRPITGRACDNCFDAQVLEKWDQGGADVETGHQQGRPPKTRVCDVLDIPSAACKACFNFMKRVSDVVHCLRQGAGFRYPHVDADVLASERVREGISKNVIRYLDEEEDSLRLVPDSEWTLPTKRKTQDDGRVEILTAAERVRAKSTLWNMRAHISIWAQKIAGYILFKLLRIILRTVQVCPGQIEKVKEVTEAGVPVVYLPNHRSHLDYVLLSFTLAQFRFRTPYVAAGDNLNIPVFSWLLRSLGAFFIKRRMDKKDDAYRAVLHSYIEELLKNGESVEFFAEAGRSRTGRLILPKAGLLSIVVDTYLQGLISDAYIVPVSISYEKLMEGSFSSELMGEPKKNESFWVAVKAIWNVFSTKYGSVRIDFGQPVSVKDYLVSLRNHMPPLPTGEASEISSPSFDVCRQQFRSKSLSSRNSLLSLCSGVDLNLMTDENRRLIRALSHHIAFDFTQNAALMCTQMLSFLLITKYRRGGRLDDIVDDFHWLCRRVLASGRDVGFSGDPRDVVRYAIELLRPELVTAEISDIDSGVVSDSGSGGGWNPAGGARPDKEVSESHSWIVKPTTALPRLLDLAYYAAPVNQVFVQEALIANAVLALESRPRSQADDALSLLVPSGSSGKHDSAIPSSNLIDRALAIADLLQYEYLFARPCASLRQCLEKTLDKMVQEGLLVRRSCTGTTTTSQASTWSVRFCLDRNQIVDAPTYSSSSSRRSSISTSFGPMDDDVTSASGHTLSEKRRKKAIAEGTFYAGSEEEEMADYEDEVDEEEDDVFGKPFSVPSTSHRRSSYGIASLVDSEDEYNSDVVRLYATVLAPLLEAYKFAFKNILAQLTQPGGQETLMRTQWKPETELIQALMHAAKELARDNSCHYAELVNIESMRNALKWLVSKGVVVSSHDRLRLHDAYIDDRETLDRFNTEIDDLCVVATY